MARDTETGYVYRSNIRSGFKREFAFAIKSHHEILSSLNTSRSRKRSKPEGTNLVQSRNYNERAKATKSVRSKNDTSAVDFGDDKGKSGFKNHSSGKDVRARMAKVVPKLKFTDRLKSAHSLIGSHVHYRRRLKLETQEDVRFSGIIRSSGIECQCHKCEGNMVLSPSLFEIHAGSRNKRPLDYIFLENEKTLRMALNDIEASQAEPTDNRIENVGQPVAEAEENPSNGNINHALQLLVEKEKQEIPSEMLDSMEKKLGPKGREKIISDVRWQIVNGKINDMEREESLFENIISVFHERFDITMPGEKKSIIPDMVHGKVELNKNYGGMHAAILTLGSKVISALLFRVHGNEVAEIPLAATSKRYEKKGYFRVLYLCLEDMLKKMGIEYLYLPAAEKKKEMWIKNFDFCDPPSDKLKDIEEKYSMMIFEDTFMLSKSISRRTEVDATKTTLAGSSSVGNVA